MKNDQPCTPLQAATADGRSLANDAWTSYYDAGRDKTDLVGSLCNDLDEFEGSASERRAHLEGFAAQLLWLSDEPVVVSQRQA